MFDFGERRLPACSLRQLAANISSTKFYKEGDGCYGEESPGKLPG
jgi:hypothetical protein